MNFPPRPSGYNDQPYGNQGRPNPPEPWFSEWDSQASTWVFINKHSGERTHQFPRGGGYSETVVEESRYRQGGGYDAAPPQQKSHAGRNTALAAIGGLAGGALLMHEGHKVEEKWDDDKARFDYDKDRVEDDYRYGKDRVEDRVDYDRERFDDRAVYDVDRFDDRARYDRDRFEDRVAYADDRFDDRVRYDEDRVRDFPDDAAAWTGRKVQEVEDIPEDVAGWTGRKVQEVEDIPEDVAGWMGRRVQGVEDFGDNIEGSFDAGRMQQEYRDDNRYDDRW